MSETREQNSVPVGGEKLFTATKEYAYHSREDMIEKILELDAKIKVLETSEKPVSPVVVDNSAVITGMSQEINYLKEELAKVWARIVALENKPAVTEPSDVNQKASTDTVTP